MSIHIHNITKTFGSFNALKNVNLEVKTGELVALRDPGKGHGQRPGKAEFRALGDGRRRRP